MTVTDSSARISDDIPAILRESEAVRFGSFTLTSGKSSNVYVDVKRVWTHPDWLCAIARAFERHLRTGERLAGMELGAVPLVVATALQSGRQFVIIRKQTRAHGTQQRIEGEVPEGANFVLLEDVTTSGGSAAESVELLRAAGATVHRALVVVDREEGAAARLQALGVTLVPLATLAEVRSGSP